MPRGGKLQGRTVAISSAFDENTIRAIANAADEHGNLVRRTIRDQTPLLGLARSIARVLPPSSAVGRFAANQTTRVEDGALPADVRVAPSAEFVRVIGARKRSALTHSIGNARWKVMFDRAASRVDYGDASALVSMPGSSLKTFEANMHRQLFFHEIDAHPRTRNELLEHHYGARYARAETFPKWFVERIEAEISLADRVLVPSTVVARQMLANGVPQEKLIQVPYGVDPSTFRPNPAAGSRAAKRLAIVCTAQISLRKGIPFLLQAVRNRPVDLTIVGSIFDSRIVANLPSNVTLAGVLNPAQLADLYARSDLFVLPSIEDCFSLVVAEAAGAGLPVITTKENGAHEVLSARHVVLDAGSSDALGDAIDSATGLAWEERLAISEEAVGNGWTDWPTYGTNVLRAMGVAE